jgi:hypothetical protein
MRSKASWDAKAQTKQAEKAAKVQTRAEQAIWRLFVQQMHA